MRWSSLCVISLGLIAVAIFAVTATAQSGGNPFDNQTAQHDALLQTIANLQETLDQLRPSPPCGPETSGTRFVLVEGGTAVCDNTTGLVWERAPEFPLGITVTQQIAIDHCATQADGLWVLPTVDQMTTLLDRSNVDPALPANHPFVLSLTGRYWTASVAATNPSAGWFVQVGSGSVGTLDNSAFGGGAWCVRGGQSFDGDADITLH